MNLGHIILVVIATIVGYSLYANIEASRKRDYFETHEVDKECRMEMEKEEYQYRLVLIARLIIWLACSVSALCGEVLGAILSAVFTVEALAHIYAEAYRAVRSRVSSLTMLAIPFGAFIMVIGMKHLGIIVGILLGILAVATVQICAYLGRQTGGEE